MAFHLSFLFSLGALCTRRACLFFAYMKECDEQHPGEVESDELARENPSFYLDLIFHDWVAEKWDLGKALER